MRALLTTARLDDNVVEACGEIWIFEMDTTWSLMAMEELTGGEVRGNSQTGRSGNENGFESNSRGCSCNRIVFKRALLDNMIHNRFMSRALG